MGLYVPQEKPCSYFNRTYRLLLPGGSAKSGESPS
jgi:hypothetical protein